MMFPSPDGVFFISYIWIILENQLHSLSFRPLPGSFLFHLLLFRLMKKGSLFPSPAGVLFISSSVLLSESGQIYVSVPCRGLFYFIKNMKNNKTIGYKFPSPAGVFFISSL